MCGKGAQRGEAGCEESRIFYLKVIGWQELLFEGGVRTETMEVWGWGKVFKSRRACKKAHQQERPSRVGAAGLNCELAR